MNNPKRVALSAVLCLALATNACSYGQKPTSPAAQNQKEASVTIQKKAQNFQVDHTTEVLIDSKVDSNEIVKVVQHGDHWHVFTKDGREIITYTDPAKAKSSRDLKKTAKVVTSKELDNIDPNTVVKILQHGNHWHIFTAGGSEFVTYTDPRPYYPHATVGTYTGSHADHSSSKPNIQQARTNKTKANLTGAKQNKNLPKLPGGLSIVRVVGLRELSLQPIVRIAKHGDHWHAYTKDGSEFITHDNPVRIFPNIKIENYIGEHGKSNKPSKTKVTPIKQDPNDPKRIVGIEHHEDHWHLRHADGTESITRDDPCNLYPDIKIEEYDPTHGKHFDPVKDNERFEYDDVEAKLIVPLDKLSYGGATHTTRFDKSRNAFVIPHYDHYHYVSIDTIIQFCRDGGSTFGSDNARDVVATLKYLVLHPEARPEGKNGWGNAATVDKNETKPAENNNQDEKEAPEIEKKATRIVQVNKGCWVVYFEDGSYTSVYSNPESKYPGIAIEQAESKSPNAGMSDQEIIAKYSALYGMSKDEFNDAFFELPNVKLKDIVFNNDGTVVVYGKTYNFKALAGKN